MSRSNDGDGVEVHVSAEVATLTRVNILAHVARDIVSSVGVPSVTIEITLTGIRRRALEEVSIRCYDSLGKRRAFLSLRIDWDTYALQLTQDVESNRFEVDPNNPISEQVVPLLARCTQYVAEKTAGLEIVTTKVSYQWRSNNTAAREISQQYGLVALTLADLTEIEEAASEKAEDLAVVDHHLPELSFTYRSKEIDE